MDGDGDAEGSWKRYPEPRLQCSGTWISFSAGVLPERFFIEITPWGNVGDLLASRNVQIKFIWEEAESDYAKVCVLGARPRVKRASRED